MTGLLSVGTPKDTIDVEIVHPVTGETLYNADGSPMTITIHGPYSSRYKSLRNKKQNKRLMKSARTGGRVKITAEELDADTVDIIAKCIDGWNITLENNGDKVPFTEEKAREVINMLPWVRDQIEIALEDTGAFLA